ncbi:MAG: shikimate kinase [Phycisphaerales bacterium]
MILVLLGLRGSGKSAVGSAIARRSGVPFLDLDMLTAVRLHAVDAAEAISTRGWEAFRLAECEAMADAVLAHDRSVLSLGGGTPTAPGASARLTRWRDDRRALLVYLHASPDTLCERLRGTDIKTRPAILGVDAIGEVHEVYQQRDGLYRTLAHVVVDAEGPVAGVTLVVLEAWEAAEARAT